MKINLTEKECEQLREIFPAGYAKVISKRLNKAGIEPTRAQEYTPKIITGVLSGHQSDFNVVLELFRYKDEILTKDAELKQLITKNYEPAQDNPANKNQE